MRYARQGANTLKYFLIGTSFRFLFILFGILAMVLFEVLHINNKKETSHFLKSLSNAYVFLCRIVGTPLYSIFWKRRIQALYPDFIVCSVCRTFGRFYPFKAFKPIMYYIIRYNKSNLVLVAYVFLLKYLIITSFSSWLLI